MSNLGLAERERAILYPTRAHKSIHSRGLVFDRALKDPALDRSSCHTCADSPCAQSASRERDQEGAARQ